MSKILAFGDSITWGAVDPDGGGWVGRLKTLLEVESDFEVEIYNLGVSGETTDGLLERLESETKARLKEDREITFIFAIGINDSLFIHSKNDLNIKLEKIKENIQKIISIARKFSSRIIFIGLTPVDEAQTTPIPWNTDKSYKNEYIKEYNEVIKSICKEKDIPFVDIFEKWIESDYKRLLIDGVHPNSDGHKDIFELVKKTLDKNKI